MSPEKDFVHFLPNSAKRIISSALEDIQPGLGNHPHTVMAVRESVENAISHALEDVFENCGEVDYSDCSNLAEIIREAAMAQPPAVNFILEGIAQSIECVEKN